MPTRTDVTILKIPKEKEARQIATKKLKKLNEEIRMLESMKNDLRELGREGWRSHHEVGVLLLQKQAMRKVVMEEDCKAYKPIVIEKPLDPKPISFVNN